MFYQIEDNFFDDPYSIRQIALCEIQKNHSCILNDNIDYYPGVRVKAPKEINEIIIRFMQDKFDSNVTNYTSSFHITSRIHQCGLIHIDQDIKYAGVVYLNENPPNHSGTILCSERECRIDMNKFNKASTTKDFIILDDFVKYKKTHNQSFNIEFELENKFNRLVLYDANQCHAPYNYFGNNLFNSRLVLVYGFNLI